MGAAKKAKANRKPKASSTKLPAAKAAKSAKSVRAAKVVSKAAPPTSKPEGRAAKIAATPPPRSRVQRLPPSAPEARDASVVVAKAIPPDPIGPTDGSRGKYVYCVIYGEKPLSFGPLGIGTDPADVHTVNYKDIAAVVSDTAIAVHEPTRANVLAHERVNETVMRDHTVIPMSFGTVFKTRDDIHELLRSAYDAFKDVLVKMEDKLEFGLKVLWDRDLIIKELENDNEDIRRLICEIKCDKGSTYFALMLFGRLVDAALGQRSDK